MVKYTFLILTLLHAIYFMAQDVDLYSKGKNDNYSLPNIAPDMTYEEFELLSQNVRMKDMMYASIVPGFMHFKAQENKKAYWLLGVRSVAFLSMGTVLFDMNATYGKINFSNVEIQDKKVYQNVFYSALALASATYLYDIIHGEYILKKKQEKIRYKYSIKAGRIQSNLEKNRIYPFLTYSLQF